MEGLVRVSRRDLDDIPVAEKVTTHWTITFHQDGSAIVAPSVSDEAFLNRTGRSNDEQTDDHRRHNPTDHLATVHSCLPFVSEVVQFIDSTHSSVHPKTTIQFNLDEIGPITTIFTLIKLTNSDKAVASSPFILRFSRYQKAI
jgi:hypothetical protein